MRSFLKIFTTRNAFSREYGTWLIVLFNMVLVPLLLHDISSNTIVFFLSVLCFLMFRFELLDYFSIELQFTGKSKIISGVFFLLLSVGLFLYLVSAHFIPFDMAIFIAATGILMVVFNIITRRKKAQRQNVIAQITLVCFISFLGALNYYFITGLFNKTFFVIFLFSALYFSNSVVYVRAKTVGSPYDLYAFLFSISVITLIILLGCLSIVRFEMAILFIPTFVKTLDNIVLLNIKVPLRRIGINETIHGVIFIILFCLLFRLV